MHCNRSASQILKVSNKNVNRNTSNCQKIKNKRLNNNLLTVRTSSKRSYGQNMMPKCKLSNTVLNFNSANNNGISKWQRTNKVFNVNVNYLLIWRKRGSKQNESGSKKCAKLNIESSNALNPNKIINLKLIRRSKTKLNSYKGKQ